MSKWKEVNLGEVVQFQRGFDLPKSKVVFGEFPVAGSNGIIGFHNEFSTDGPGITIGRSGNIGTPHFYKDKYWAHNTVLFVKDFKGNNEPFIYYFLKTLDFHQFNTGSAVPSLNRNHIHQIQICLPPLPEQKAIASVLSSLDDKIDLLHRQNETLEKMAETLFRQWFVEEARDDWEEVKLKSISDIGIGRTPPRKEFHWFSKNTNDMKWVSIKDMGELGIYINNTSEYLTHEAVEKFNIPIIPKDTVILSFKMTLGRIGITSEDMLSNEAIAHFKLKSDTSVTKEYLYFYLKNYKFDSLGSTSSIVTSINSSMIKDMDIIIPNDKLIEKFQKIAKLNFEKIKNNQQQIQTLSKLRDTLLPKLMSGEVRVGV